MRTEKDSLGERQLPDEAYYGIQTLRAVENFPISGIRSDPEMVRSIGAVKLAAALTNAELDLLDAGIADAIAQAAREVFDGKWYESFVVDVFQAGAGTSFNMNANEVIANRALEILGYSKGEYGIINPNDHVNMAQSTNDVFPTVMRITILSLLRELLLPGLLELETALRERGEKFDHIVKAGRTHLQDAVPIRLGQEFSAYAESIKHASAAIESAGNELKRMNVGGTAVGTGLNSHPEYREWVVEKIRVIAGLPVNTNGNLIELTESTADFARFSAALKNCALELIRIANDLRLLSSGPRTGFAEISLPAVQPGSSIMPGKVNPSIPEMVNMVCFQVMGNDLAISVATQAGQLELNVMMPLIAHNLVQSVRILSSASSVFALKCIQGITANEEVCRKYAEQSESLITALNPIIGYATAAEIAKEALATGRSIREIVLGRGLMTKEALDQLLDPIKMTRNKGGTMDTNAKPKTISDLGSTRRGDTPK